MPSIRNCEFHRKSRASLILEREVLRRSWAGDQAFCVGRFLFAFLPRVQTHRGGALFVKTFLQSV
jgi:hypothetical protein